VTTEKKNLCIQELKKELEHANELIEAVKQRKSELPAVMCGGQNYV
jgi:hypothetical protein